MYFYVYYHESYHVFVGLSTHLAFLKFSFLVIDSLVHWSVC